MSKQAIRDFIQNYVSISDDEWKDISSFFHYKEYKKGQLLLKEGAICNSVSFLETGLLRFFVWKDGETITKFFTIAPYMLTSQRSFSMQIPAKENIEAIEDSSVWELMYEDNERLLKIETWNIFVRKLTQEVQYFTEEIMEDLQNKTAEQRYYELIDYQPELLQRIPLKYLASFLGITPQSLSRIRRKIQ